MAEVNIYVGLVHYPVYNKQKEIVVTSITNMDIHDISRTCKTYGVSHYLIINPLDSQRELFRKIVNFWQSDTGRKYQGDRATALDTIDFFSSLAEAKEYIKNQEGLEPVIITTTAREWSNQSGYDIYPSISKEQRPIFIIFGTGYGLAEELHHSADFVLKPVTGRGDYNHLSVRSAVAIVLDRMLPKNTGGTNGFIASS